jgi:multiple sugar transport system permease protein
MFRLTKKKKHDLLAGYFFVSPWILGFLIFIIFPILASLFLSFTKYDILSSPKFIGLENWKRMFLEDRRFLNATKATLKYVIFAVPARLLFAFIVALILNLSEHKIIRLYRAIYYVPSLVGGSVAVAVMWRQIFGLDGLVNFIMEKILGMSRIIWLGDPKTAIWTLILLAMWQFGSPMLIFLAGLKQIPESLYEAASIDGATFWPQLFKITIPMLSPVIFFNLVMQTIGGFMVFTQAYIITGGAPLDTTLFYALYIYQKGFRDYDMGYASAMAWFLLVIIAIITFILFKTSGRWVYYEAERGR